MAKKIGLGIVLAYESTTPGTFTTVGELLDFTPAELTVETVDATDHSHTDGIRRQIAALADNGEFSATFAFDPALTVHAALTTIAKARAVKSWRWTFTTGTAETFPVILTNVGRQTPMDDTMTMSISGKVSGAEIVA
jgi:hypothetical protein